MPDPNDTFFPLIPLTPAAEEELSRFTEACEQQEKRLRQLSLTILVWGPDPTSNTPVARKRVDIRNRLVGLGHLARFSEENSPIGPLRSQKTRELAEAQEAHLAIILIEDSQGPLAEAHDFADRPEIAPNCLVFVPTRYRKGYSAMGILQDLEDGYSAVVWYEPSDIEECNVLRQVVRRAEARRAILYRAGRTSN